MRVALVNLTSGGISGGYRKYLQSVIPLLAEAADVELEVLSPAGMEFTHYASVEHWYWPSNDNGLRFRALRRHLEQRAPDVIFIPTARYLATGFPTVVMVRNMEPLVIPFSGNSFADGFRNVARRFVARASSGRADRVIAVSAYVRDYIRDRWNLPPSKLAVVPHGVGDPTPAGDQARPASIASELVGRFVFAAGSIRPARGFDDVIGAIALLASRGIPTTLVIAGTVSGNAQGYHSRLRARIDALAIGNRVIWTGELSAPEMAWCFSNCAAFAMTSRVEACPNTVLEALSYGTLAVSSTLRPMPEFFGNGALYYEVGNEAELALKLAEILAFGPEARQKMAGHARARAALYNWPDTVGNTIAVLRNATNR